MKRLLIDVVQVVGISLGMMLIAKAIRGIIDGVIIFPVSDALTVMALSIGVLLNRRFSPRNRR